MALDTSGIERFKLQLLRLAEIPDLANEELALCAAEVAQKARDMAPEDYADLKGAIQVGRRGAQGAGGRFVSGVSNYDVYINERHPVSDPDKLDNGVTNVGDYAWYVHEHMGWGNTPGTGTLHGKPFMPSEKSVLKGMEKNVEAGGHFLTRAALELEGGIYARLVRKVMKHVKSLDN